MTDELVGKINWLLREKELAEEHAALHGPDSFKKVADRLHAADREAFALLPEILATITRLQAAADAMDGALERLARIYPDWPSHRIRLIRDIARTALTAYREAKEPKP